MHACPCTLAQAPRICVRACAYFHAHAFAHACMPAHAHSRKPLAFACVHVHTFTRTHSHMHACLPMHASASPRNCVHACAHFHARICKSIHAHVRTFWLPLVHKHGSSKNHLSIVLLDTVATSQARKYGTVDIQDMHESAIDLCIANDAFIRCGVSADLKRCGTSRVPGCVARVSRQECRSSVPEEQTASRKNKDCFQRFWRQGVSIHTPHHPIFQGSS